MSAKRLSATSSRALRSSSAGAGIGCLVQLGTVRLIGADSFGISAYVIAWTTVLGYIATLGFHVSLLRLLPAYQVGEDWSPAKAVLRFAIGGTVMAGIVLGRRLPQGAAGYGRGSADKPQDQQS